MLCCDQLLLLVFLLISEARTHEVGNRPKIKTSDGDLLFESAPNRHIKFRTNGPHSKIFLNDAELKIGNQTVTVQDLDLRSNIEQTIRKVLRGPRGVIRRLNALEHLLPSNNISYSDEDMNSRLVMLEARIKTISEDHCLSSPCENGAVCISVISGYHCQCLSNWKGKNCDEDVNECWNFAGTELGCQNGGLCLNKPGSYECLCMAGWYGTHCTRRAKDCSGGNAEMCGHGTCLSVSTGEGIKCLCDPGWTTDGNNPACIIDINECESTSVQHCSVNPKAQCINLPGSFKCGPCPAGYEGDGFACSDIDECMTQPNGGCSISPLVTCTNTIGSRICGLCPPGYDGDGVICTWRGSCSFMNGGCHPSAKCVENVAVSAQFVQCICPNGMSGDGVGMNGCYFLNSNKSFTCDKRTCGTHGICVQLSHGYSCVCRDGYTGLKCDVAPNRCQPNPCLNGGVCKIDNGLQGYLCECPSTYTGFQCQTHVKSCGGLLSSREGKISYPLTNSTDKVCAWVIRTIPNKVINVTFEHFHLLCHTEFLQIHDGINSGSHLIGRFCGSEYPLGGNIISSHNHLYFWYRSDRNNAHGSFLLHWNSTDPVCGETITIESHGRISSPGSPGNYPPNRDCYWYLQAPAGKRIQLHFFQLDIERHENCSYDYLAVFDGLLLSDPIIAKFCNTSQPQPLQSLGTSLLIHFHSDAQGSGAGFMITYSLIEGIPGCGGTYTASEGELTVPKIDGLYMNHLLCDYFIKLPPETQIQVEFRSFDVERSFSCRFDYLAIYDGPSSESKLAGKFCGKRIPENYVSSSNSLMLRFKSDGSMSGEGFLIKYSLICKQTFTGESGIIQSPGYPNSYPVNRECDVLIHVSVKRAIKLTFLDFEVEEGYDSDCEYDKVEVRDGIDVNSTLIGVYCGDKIPPVIISQLNVLNIKFYSDNSFQGRGFQANYTTINIKCGGVHTKDNDIISHPSETSQTEYGNDENCTWIIIAPPGFVITLTWIRFDVETRADYLSIEEIDNDGVVYSIANYSGTSLPPMISSSTEKLKLRFTSDHSGYRAGFSLRYSFKDTKTSCGGHYFKPQGYIYSPGWPDRYPRQRDCEWIVTVPVGQQIMLNVSEFHIENSYRSNCIDSDYLEIRNGPSVQAPLIGKYCGTNIPKRIPSHGNTIFLHFHSDEYLTGKGFKIYWDGTSVGCGGTLTSYSGSLYSPNYPQPYAHNAECFWKISVSLGSKIHVIFSEIDLESNFYCRNDYIEIYDGTSVKSNSLGHFCSMSSSSRDIISTSNNLFIKFRSDISIAGKGFALNYYAICNNTISGLHGIVESPGFPNEYSEQTYCLWTLMAPKGNKIKAEFTHFNLGLSQVFTRYRFSHFDGCRTQYIQTKEATNEEFGPKRCNSNPISKIQTKDNQLQIKFVSAAYLRRDVGFRLEWSVDGCGGKIRKAFGILNVSHELSSSHDVLECEWMIETDVGTAVQINITPRIRNSQNCTIDYIDVYNGPSSSSPLLMKLCDKGQSTITSGSNVMFVKLSKTSSLLGPFIDAYFSSVQGSCGGKLSGVSGFLTSPNYPHNYDPNLDCLWYITVPPNHLIELNIVDFDLFFVSYIRDCRDFIRIYNGFDIAQSNYSAQYCPDSSIRNTSMTFLSNTDKIVVQFVTDGFGFAKGFKANYSMTCGARIKASKNGILIFSEKTNNNCTWTIIASKPEQKVSVTLTHININRSSETNSYKVCPSEYLKIYDGDDTNAPLKGVFCGKKTPPTIVSYGNSLTLELGSYIGKPNGKFTASYSVLDTFCGGLLTSEEGSFTSPNYPDAYPMSTDCEWTLRTSPGNRVYITFASFDLLDSMNCNEDYVELREINGFGKLLGVFCGDKVPTNMTTASQLYIKFHSSVASSRSGFLAHYGFIHGDDITGLEKGEIASPLYPLPYDGPVEVFWRITTKPLTLIFISVTKANIDNSENECDNYLGFYDGFDDSAPMLTKICSLLAYEEKTSFETTSNMLYIKLSLSDSNAGSLFTLKWSEISKSSNDSSNENCRSSDITNVRAGGIIVLTSPNFPQSYENGLECEWIFRTDPGNHLQVKFTSFDIEVVEGCYDDYVSLYRGSEGLKEWVSISDRLCLPKTVQLPPIDSSNYLKITFKTDYYVSQTGFQAKIISTCGGTISMSSGVLIPNPAPSSTATSCSWVIKVRPGRSMNATFESFSLPKSQSSNFCSNYVTLRNGESSESPVILSKYCGLTPPTDNQFITTSNSLFINYYSSSAIFSKSPVPFILHFEELHAECGFTSNLDTMLRSQIISTPNYPDIPQPYTECSWVLYAPPGENLRLDFMDRFDIQSSLNCEEEFVAVYDGGSENSPLLGKFCNKQPASIETTNNAMLIKYVTNLEEPRNGFKANVSINVCGGTLVASYLAIDVTSPGYPKMLNLPVGTVCEWRVLGLPGHSLFIIPKTISFPESESKCQSNITIEEKLQNNDTRYTIKEYCNDEHNFEAIKSISSEIFITLYIQKPRAGLHISDFRGFKFTINSTKSQCGGSFNSPSGFVTSPGYPHDVTGPTYCFWKIIVPDITRRVTLEFLELSPNPRGYRLRLYNDFFSSPIAVIDESYNTSRNIVKSDGNKMFIYLISQSHQFRRFRAKFSSDEPALCGGILEGDSGVIVAPADTNNYVCSWELKYDQHSSPDNGTILLKVNVTTTFDKPQCFASRMVISWASTFSQTRSLCHSGEEVLRLPTSKLKLVAFEGNDVPFNFNVVWFKQPCGGKIHDEGKNDDVLNLPNFHKGSLDCAWVLTSYEKRVKLQLKGVFTGSCSDEYILIARSFSAPNTNLRKFCKSEAIDNTIISALSQYYIQYHSSYYSNNTNIQLFVNAVDSASSCGGVLEKYDVYFQSPNYPKSYPSNVECIWEITTDVGSRINLTFIERFNIETTTNCSKDSITIFDWVNGKYIEKSKVCGRTVPGSFNSTSYKMKITFRSDSTVNSDGFKARWNRFCGGEFVATKDEEFIFSPGYPSKYFPNQKCHYSIEVDDPKKVKLTFLEFDLENKSNQQCESDNLTITSIYSDENVYCGSSLPPTKKYQGIVIIDFTTDLWIQKKGFKISYKIDTCGGSINESSMISSGDLIDEDYYENDLNCTWILSATENKHIVIKFLYFDLESQDDCEMDYLSIYDSGTINDDRRLALLCGNLNGTTMVFKSSKNIMTVNFVTDYSIGGKGFAATIHHTYGESVGCGGKINLASNHMSVLRSPLISNKKIYEPFLECIWVIQAPPDNVISVKFNKFHIAPCEGVNQTGIGINNCHCDSVDIRDGANPMSLSIGRYCGHLIPPTVSTSSNYLYVRLSTDSDVESAGFEAEIRAKNTICGKERLTSSNTIQTLKSPGFSEGHLPEGLHCTYVIEGGYYVATQIIVKSLDLLAPTGGNQCIDDKLLISQEIGKDRVTLGKDFIISKRADEFFNKFSDTYLSEIASTQNLYTICGKVETKNFFVMGNAILNLVTSTNSEKNRKGFEIEYFSIDSCSRNYSDLQGRIQLRVADDKDDCYTHILVPENYTISIVFFSTFNVYLDNDLIDIYDGSDVKAKRLLHVTSEYDQTYPVFSTGRDVLIHLRGYGVTIDLNYYATNKGIGCGGQVNYAIGIVSSPMYPNPYRKTTTCEWILESLPGTQLVLSFKSFDLGSRQICDQVYLQLLDREEKVYTTFCAGDNPGIYRSNNNYVKIVFKSTVNNGGSGWIAEFIGEMV